MTPAAKKWRPWAGRCLADFVGGSPRHWFACEARLACGDYVVLRVIASSHVAALDQLQLGAAAHGVELRGDVRQRYSRHSIWLGYAR